MKIESLSFPTAARSLNAYFARPDDEGPFPGLIVIHEISGLNSNICKITKRFAEAGYAALGVDLFTGLSPVGRALPVCLARYFFNQIFHSLDNGGIRDLKAALAFLAARPEVDEERLGAAGSGWFLHGRRLRNRLGLHRPKVARYRTFYGYNPRPLEAVRRSCPVVGAYLANDRFLTQYSGRRLDKELDQGKVPHDIKIYSGTKHSFCNDSLTNYDAAACEDSFRRILKFFEQHMRDR